MEQLKLGSNSKVNVKWQVLPIDYSHEAEESIRTNFANKYGINRDNVKVSPVFIRKEKNGNIIQYSNDITENIQNPKFQQQLFKKYLDMKNVTDYDFDQILEIDDSVNASVNYEVYEPNKKYSIKWIKWSNFMSYGKDNYFDFTKLSGLVLLTSDPANQGGKTTFCLDLIRFLLFGQVTSRGNFKNEDVFNIYLPEETECIVEGCICINGVDYVIKRTVKRPPLNKRTEKSRVSSDVKWYKFVNNEYIELNDEENCQNGLSVTETNKIIKESIGNYKDFDLMICVDSDNLKSLISLKDTDRGNLITRWIGLAPLEEKESVAKDNYKSVEDKFLSKRYSKEALKEENNSLKNTIEKNNQTIETNKVAIEKTSKKIEEYNQQKEVLLLGKQQIDPSLLRADVHTVEITIENIKANGEKKKIEKENYEKRLNQLKNVDFNKDIYNDLINERRNIEQRLYKSNAQIERFKNLIETTRNSEYCPTCHRKYDNIETKENDIKKAEEEMTAENKNNKVIKQELDNIVKNINSMEQNRVLFEEKEKIELLIEKIGAEMEYLRGKYKENNRLLKDIEKNKVSIENNNKIDISLNNLKETIRVEQGYLDRLKSDNSVKETENKNNSLVIENNTKIIDLIEKEEVIKRNWNLYFEIIGKNGIRKMVLREVLPMINGELKHLLTDVCDFDVEVDILPNNNVIFYKIHDGVRTNLSTGSGFEKTVASLALRSVLGKISSFSKPSFVIFDEILGGVADVNYDNLKTLYDKILPSYQLILEITHLKQIADWHSQTVLITKENNISKIKQI